MVAYDKAHGLLAALAAVAMLAGTVQAQAPSGRQTTPDEKQVLVNRAEGGLQWAISLSPNPGTITGNVFDPNGGPPSFVWCERTGDDGVMDPAEVEIFWRCEGADSCPDAPCLPDEWSALAEVPLPGSFFLPARDPFVPLQPPGTYCDPLRVGFVNEFVGQPSYEVDTAICRYASMTQSTLTPIEADEDLFVRVWNFALEEPKGGTAFFTLMLGDEVIYSETIPIPKESGLFGPYGVPAGDVGICLRPGVSAPAGTPISYNLQIREASAAQATTDGSGDAPTAGILELGRPLHSTPGVVHMLEITVGSNCFGEPQGRRLILNDRWVRVSTGVPESPPAQTVNVPLQR